MIIVNVRRMIDSGIELDKLSPMVDYFLNYVISHAMVSGKVENWVTIFDLRNVGVTQIPRDRIQGIVKSMGKNYRGRLFRFFATDVTLLVRGVWKMAHKFVDEFTNKKLLIFGNDYGKELLELMDEDCLEEKYGGKQPNKDNFWPPQFS